MGYRFRFRIHGRFIQWWLWKRFQYRLVQPSNAELPNGTDEEVDIRVYRQLAVEPSKLGEYFRLYDTAVAG